MRGLEALGLVLPVQPGLGQLQPRQACESGGGAVAAGLTLAADSAQTDTESFRRGSGLIPADRRSPVRLQRSAGSLGPGRCVSRRFGPTCGGVVLAEWSRGIGIPEPVGPAVRHRLSSAVVMVGNPPAAVSR